MELIVELLIKWAIPFIAGTLLTALLSYIKKKTSAEIKKDKAIENAVQALLRNELIRRYREYEEKGEISILDKENITHMYQEYKNLGGNGTVEKLYSELLNLHTKIVK